MCMPKPLPEDLWKVTVSAQYQEAMKIPINWATACLALPIIFLRWGGGVNANGVALARLGPAAYLSWLFLGLSLISGFLFFGASAKFVKAVSGGYPEEECVRLETFFERMRDISAAATLLLFGLGVASSLYFLVQTLQAQPR
jgi:hypothetical protein